MVKFPRSVFYLPSNKSPFQRVAACQIGPSLCSPSCPRITRDVSDSLASWSKPYGPLEPRGDLQLIVSPPFWAQPAHFLPHHRPPAWTARGTGCVSPFQSTKWFREPCSNALIPRPRVVRELLPGPQSSFECCKSAVRGESLTMNFSPRPVHHAVVPRQLHPRS